MPVILIGAGLWLIGIAGSMSRDAWLYRNRESAGNAAAVRFCGFGCIALGVYLATA